MFRIRTGWSDRFLRSNIFLKVAAGSTLFSFHYGLSHFLRLLSFFFLSLECSEITGSCTLCSEIHSTGCVGLHG